MTISERLFSIMKPKGISVSELARMTGISRHTIFDWQKKNTNPGADKIMLICESLSISPQELLLGDKKTEGAEEIHIEVDGLIMEGLRELSEAKKKRLLAYMSMLNNTKE